MKRGDDFVEVEVDTGEQLEEIVEQEDADADDQQEIDEEQTEENEFCINSKKMLFIFFFGLVCILQTGVFPIVVFVNLGKTI